MRRFNATITSLDQSFALLKPIPVTIKQIDESFVASFRDANAHASGETIDEAVSNLASLVTDLFDEFSRGRLDVGPAREFAALRQFITKRTPIASGNAGAV
jgi:hypothetical protein